MKKHFAGRFATHYIVQFTQSCTARTHLSCVTVITTQQHGCRCGVFKDTLEKMCCSMLKANSTIVKSMVGRGHGHRRCEEHVWHGKWAVPKVEKKICGRLPRINEYMANIGLCIYPIASNYTRMLCLCRSAVTPHTSSQWNHYTNVLSITVWQLTWSVSCRSWVEEMEEIKTYKFLIFLRQPLLGSAPCW